MSKLIDDDEADRIAATFSKEFEGKTGSSEESIKKKKKKAEGLWICLSSLHPRFLILKNNTILINFQ